MALCLDGLKWTIAAALGFTSAGCTNPLVGPDGADDDTESRGTMPPPGGSTTDETSSTSATSSSAGTRGSVGSTTDPSTTDPSTTDPSTTDPSTSSGGYESSDSGVVPQQCWNDLPSDFFFCYGEPLEGEACECDYDCQIAALNELEETTEPQGCPWTGSILCSELVDTQCCYTVEMYYECGKGRPFMVDGKAKTAPLRLRNDWAGSVVVARHPVDISDRRTVAQHWLKAGLDEHASVASFARFALDLAAIGASPKLLADTASAMRDEVRHAELAFGLARRFGATSKGPGSLDVPVGQVRTHEDIVLAAVREGCIGETLAAAEAEVAAKRARDPLVASALEEIAADEARHAALAWRFVQWALHEHPQLRPMVEAAFAEAAHQESEPRRAPRGLEAYGVLEPKTIKAAHDEALTGTILPCAKTLTTMGSMERLRGSA